MKKKAFTLIELLVVIAIIGILATISVLALSNARAKSRDAKRAGDMKQIQTALELFFNDNNRYPTAEEWNTGKIYSTSTGATSTYMQVIPTAPTPADGICSNNQNSISYIPASDGSSYSISFCLGNTTGTLTSGPKCLTPGGISDVDCCGSEIVYEGESYQTVKIGGQCWFARNLDAGTMLCSDNPGGTSCLTDSSNDNVLEKYCYNNLSSNCDIYGGLYTWNETMSYTTVEGSRGICPPGWHIPSGVDWNNLLSAVGTNPAEKLKVSTWDSGLDSFGFTVLPAGDRFAAMNFGNLNIHAYFWSSLTGPSSTAISRRFDTGSSVVLATSQSPTKNAFSVRCLQD